MCSSTCVALHVYVAHTYRPGWRWVTPLLRSADLQSVLAGNAVHTLVLWPVISLAAAYHCINTSSLQHASDYTHYFHFKAFSVLGNLGYNIGTPPWGDHVTTMEGRLQQYQAHPVCVHQNSIGYVQSAIDRISLDPTVKFGSLVALALDFSKFQLATCICVHTVRVQQVLCYKHASSVHMSTEVTVLKGQTIVAKVRWPCARTCCPLTWPVTASRDLTGPCHSEPQL